MNVLDLERFLDALASKVPAPGGGATAALHVAQGAALISMVGRYSDGRRFEAHSSDIARIVGAADDLRSRALGLVTEDMKAFEAVIASYKLPKSSDVEASVRAAATASALAAAATVPARVISAAQAVITLAEELLPIGNTNVVSDVAAAADAARAGTTTARVNVEINLPGITDADVLEFLTDVLAGVDADLERADTITARVREQLNR